MTDEMRKKYEKAKELIAEGMNKRDAFKEVDMSDATFYKQRKLENGLKKNKPRKTARSSGLKAFMDFELKDKQTPKVAVVFCDPENLKEVLRGLQ